MDAEEMAQTILRRIAEIWQIDDYRVQWHEPTKYQGPSFDWWPGDYRVQVSTGFPLEPFEYPLVKVNIRTDVLKDIATDDSASFEELITTMAQASAATYGVIYPFKSLWPKYAENGVSPGLWYNSSGYVTPDTLAWLPDVLANTGIMQPINAQLHAHALPNALGCGAPDITRPASLRDAGLDGTVAVVDHIYAPAGQQPNRWEGSDEFGKFVEEWGQSDNCVGCTDTTGMVLETPFGSASALIRFWTTQKHLQLGHGCS